MHRERCSRLQCRSLLLGIALATAIPFGCVAVNAVHGKGPDQSPTAAPADAIKTSSGYVSGAIIGGAGEEVRIYRGIPYAAPPVGNLRWKPPQAVAPGRESGNVPVSALLRHNMNGLAQDG